MRIYHFPPLSLNRLVREAINGYCLRCLKFPDPDRPLPRSIRRRCSGPHPPIGSWLRAIDLGERLIHFAYNAITSGAAIA